MTANANLTHSHWGAFHAEVEGGKLVRVRPFARDPHPSPMIESWPAMVEAPTRIRQPMVREGYRRDGLGSDRTRRGAEPFVPVSWDEALDLVAKALSETRTRHGDSSIFGGSYGWSSAGRLHHARTLVRRFLFASGGCVDQVTNYSWGAAQMLLPHLVGSFDSVTGKVTSWRSVVRNTKPNAWMGPNARSFGHQGAGGSIGFGDPDARAGFGYAMNQFKDDVTVPTRAAMIQAVFDELGR